MPEYVIYNTDRGFKQVREVPIGTLPQNYFKGILIGPPNLESLKLHTTKEVDLNNALVDGGFIEYPNTRGNRRKLVQIIKNVFGNDLDSSEISLLRNSILAIYQQAYYVD